MKNIDWSKNGAKLKPQYADIVVALDIGTSKIAAVVAEIKEDDQYEVIGLGSSTSQGMKKGVVVNIESTVSAIQRALEEAELMADQKIKEVWTGIAGSHIKGFNSHGMVAVQGQEVVQADIDRVVETAKAIPIPTDQQILHV
ncbi:MAG: cell division protein FtsA, partial [Betaproteobacteria bacterium]|nr:cell division protein FtsA [Betaproteobacteria bacterium]